MLLFSGVVAMCSCMYSAGNLPRCKSTSFSFSSFDRSLKHATSQIGLLWLKHSLSMHVYGDEVLVHWHVLLQQYSVLHEYVDAVSAFARTDLCMCMCMHAHLCLHARSCNWALFFLYKYRCRRGGREREGGSRFGSSREPNPIPGLNLRGGGSPDVIYLPQ